MKAIIIAEEAFPIASFWDFDPNAEIPTTEIDPQISIVSWKGYQIATGSKTSEKSRFLVIGKPTSNILVDVPSGEVKAVIERAVRIALRGFDKSIALNPGWQPFRFDKKVSVFTHSFSKLRMVAETNVEGSQNTIVFDILEADNARDLGELRPNYRFYHRCLDDVVEYLGGRSGIASPGSRDIVFDDLAATSVTQGLTFEDWFKRLSPTQKQFVERPIVGPIRVRGAAGTGKTLAMVIKAINHAREGYHDGVRRILFLTHSWAMAEQVDSMIRQIAPNDPAVDGIEVFPLLEISRRRDYAAIGRHPLGLDSEEGKRKTLQIILETLAQFKKTDWDAYRADCTPPFVDLLEAGSGSKAERALCWDLLVEFGCVLAAEGLLGRQVDQDRYLRIRRAGYMMRLENRAEKECVFNIWRLFLERLREEHLIAADQIVSDYLNELQTFYWEAARSKEGFYAVFVDEMHLFNSQERLTFHHLVANGDIPPKVVMALDPKQSPREVFASIDSEDDAYHTIYQRARLPNPEKIDFVEVYRYTPEIANLISCVSEEVPALELNEDWDIPSGASIIDSGQRPELIVYADQKKQFQAVHQLAKRLQAEARSSGGQVAILCLDYDRFDTYRRAASGQFANDVFVIKSRDDVDKLRYMTRRIIYSTPEYVAGLQFHSVIVVDANRNLIAEGAFRGTQERRFLSELYLGMSRAEQRLVITATNDGGGVSPYLEKACVGGLLTTAS